jgi:hypothetical protein
MYFELLARWRSNAAGIKEPYGRILFVMRTLIWLGLEQVVKLSSEHPANVESNEYSNFKND